MFLSIYSLIGGKIEFSTITFCASIFGIVVGFVKQCECRLILHIGQYVLFLCSKHQKVDSFDQPGFQQVK